ncbi:hypothetical protein PJP10_32695, partial [Mycobacterium kansasii]
QGTLTVSLTAERAALTHKSGGDTSLIHHARHFLDDEKKVDKKKKQKNIRFKSEPENPSVSLAI